GEPLLPPRAPSFLACDPRRTRACGGRSPRAAANAYVDRASLLPSPVLTGSGSTGVISARSGTPVRPGYHRKMAVRTVLWDDLLEGQELAHLETVASAEPRTAPLPAELHPRLREAMPFDSLYAHQRAAWDAAARREHLI